MQATKAQTLEHYQNFERQAREITSRPIKPGTFQIREHAPGYATRRYTLTGPIEQHSDRDLLIYCGYTEEFGGRVDRMPGVAYVVVHTD